MSILNIWNTKITKTSHGEHFETMKKSFRNIGGDDAVHWKTHKHRERGTGKEQYITKNTHTCAIGHEPSSTWMVLTWCGHSHVEFQVDAIALRSENWERIEHHMNRTHPESLLITFMLWMAGDCYATALPVSNRGVRRCIHDLTMATDSIRADPFVSLKPSGHALGDVI